MKTLKQIKDKLKRDMIDKGWNHSHYCDVAEFFAKFIEKHFYEDEKTEEVKTVKPIKKVKEIKTIKEVKTKHYYEVCPKCGIRKGRKRIQTKDYRCRMCKHIFKKCGEAKA
ncbi:unnamed protein product [marine sediment metagenome]|uniref:Uncharacterized protein n=1 Tax=marine sediment metagenome TaxID=412755 RepID=X0WR06_9ZZZZ